MHSYQCRSEDVAAEKTVGFSMLPHVSLEKKHWWRGTVTFIRVLKGDFLRLHELSDHADAAVISETLAQR